MATSKKNTGKDSHHVTMELHHVTAGGRALFLFMPLGNPKDFLRMLLSDKRKIADYILQTNGIPDADIEQMKKEPRKAVSFRYLDSDGQIVEGDHKISYSELLRYIGKLQKSLKPPEQPKNYPLSSSIIKGLTGVPEKGQIVCKDENKLKKAAYCKLEHIFLTLLHETSSEKNPKHEDFFTGNAGAERVKIEVGSNFVEGRAARAAVELKDIYKKWNGGKKLGGAAKKFIANTIDEYRQLNFIWQFRVQDISGQKYIAEYPAPRVKVIFYKPEEEGDLKPGPGGLITDANAKILLVFHPVFLQTDKYANTPYNLAEILERAAGGGRNVTTAHWLVYHYLNSLRFTQRAEGGVVQNETGFNLLLAKAGLDQYLNNRNKSKAGDKIRAVISDIKKTGLLIDFSERTGTDGPIFCFSIAKDRSAC